MHDIGRDEARPRSLATRAELHSHRLARLGGEIRRRIEVVGLSPNQAVVTRPFGVILRAVDGFRG